MARVRLEIDEVRILRPKKRWNLYFIVMVEHPEDQDKMVLSILPQNPFRLSAIHNNEYQFDTDDPGSEGMFVVSREMPADRELNAHIYLRHSRKQVRDFGKILEEIQSGLGDEAFGIITELAGAAATPWLVLAKSAVGTVGKLLQKIPDRRFGFLSAFESFGPEFELHREIDREKFFTGPASLVYSWSIDED